MGIVMKASEFAKKLKDVEKNYKTLYVMGCFGAPLNEANKKRYTSNHSYNKKANRVKMIVSATADTFGFDCVCLIKGILWGWSGDKTKNYGGAAYASNDVPDVGTEMLIRKCNEVSTDFSNILVGEVLWMQGHVGVYIGNGLAVECSPQWKNGVQITAVKNIGAKAGYNERRWTKHGKLPYVEYDVAEEPKPTVPTPIQSSDAVAYVVGDFVRFLGGRHYTSASGSKGFDISSSRAKVVQIAKGTKHPYCLRAVDDKGNYKGGVYGWVDAGSVTVDTPAPTTTKIEYAQKRDNALSGKYAVKAASGLNIRAGAGTGKPIVGVLKNNALVSNYGYYSIDSNGDTWLYIAAGGITGYCSASYLKKI